MAMNESISPSAQPSTDNSTVQNAITREARLYWLRGELAARGSLIRKYLEAHSTQNGLDGWKADDFREM